MLSSVLPCQKVHPSPSLPGEDIQCSSKKKEVDESRLKYKKKALLSLKYGIVTGADCTKQTLVSKNTIGKGFHTGVKFQNVTS